MLDVGISVLMLSARDATPYPLKRWGGAHERSYSFFGDLFFCLHTSY